MGAKVTREEVEDAWATEEEGQGDGIANMDHSAILMRRF